MFLGCAALFITDSDIYLRESNIEMPSPPAGPQFMIIPDTEPTPRFGTSSRDRPV